MAAGSSEIPVKSGGEDSTYNPSVDTIVDAARKVRAPRTESGRADQEAFCVDHSSLRLEGIRLQIEGCGVAHNAADSGEGAVHEFQRHEGFGRERALQIARHF
jgi:hypothetical protein